MEYKTEFRGQRWKNNEKIPIAISTGILNFMETRAKCSESNCSASGERQGRCDVSALRYWRQLMTETC